TPVSANLMSYDNAIAEGAVALFGEKYEDEVRVLDIGFSRELCGGTHVRFTGDIGLFKIISQGSVASGIRRIEAVTGMHALKWVQDSISSLNQIAAALKTSSDKVVDRIDNLQEQLKVTERERDQLKDRLTSAASDNLLEKAIKLNSETSLLVASLDGVDAKRL